MFSPRYPPTVRWAVLIGTLLLVLPISVRSDDASDKLDEATNQEASANQSTERFDRTVDLAALDAKKRAIRTLTILARKEADRPEEPVILMRLAEAVHDVAAIQFRIAYASADPATQKKLSGTYKKALGDSLEPLNRLISKYPNHPTAARAWYLKAKTYREIGLADEAIRDYRIVIARYPQSSDVPFAHLALWDLLMDKQDYRGVIEAVNKYAAKSSDRYYGIAVTRLAWSLYYLNDFPGALKFTMMAAQWFGPRAAKSKSFSADFDKAVSDATLFYATGMEKKVPGLSPGGAVDYFTKAHASLAQDKDPGKSLVSLAYLMRSKGLDDALTEFQDLVLRSNTDDGFKYDILLVTFEHVLNERRFKDIQKSLDRVFAFIHQSDLVRKNPEKIQKSKNILALATKTLQQAIVDYKDRPEAEQLAPTLYSLYEFMLKTSTKDNSLQFKTHFNMAETAFQMHDYDRAVKHYRWLVKYRSAAPATEAKLADEATFRSISTRFEYLKKQNIIPANLAAKALQTNSTPIIGEAASEWIGWVDSYPEGGSVLPGMDLYRFEVARLIYSVGNTEMALKRLNVFIQQYPTSQYAIPAASLTLDTLVASERWQAVYETSIFYLQKKFFVRDAAYQKKLETVSSDAFYKLIEVAYREKAFAQVIEKSDQYLKTFPTGKHRNSALETAANAALALKDRPTALKYFRTLQKADSSRDDIAALSSLTSASIAEDNYDFSTALREYSIFFANDVDARKMSAEEQRSLAKKMLLLGWASANPTDLDRVLANKTVCALAGAAECNKFHNRLLLRSFGTAHHARSGKSGLLAELKAARNHSDPERLIHTAIAMEQAASLSLGDRYALLRQVAVEWDKQDPYIKVALLPSFSASVPEVLRVSRREVRTSSRVSIDKRTIAKRVKSIEEYESYANKLLGLSWAGIRAASFNEMANLYRDLADDLGSIRPPKGLNEQDLGAFKQTISQIQETFNHKRDDLRKKAFDIASNFAVSAELGEVITRDRRAANGEPGMGRESVGTSAHESVTPRFLLEVLPNPKEAPYHALLEQLALAIERQNNIRAMFLINEGIQKNILPAGYIETARGAMLALAGGVSEAMVDFAEAKNKMPYELSPRVTFVLLGTFYRSYALEKTKEYSDSIWKAITKVQAGKWLTEDDSALAIAASKWAQSEFAPDIFREFPRITNGETYRPPTKKGQVENEPHVEEP